jgi:hypothetical protein
MPPTAEMQRCLILISSVYNNVIQQVSTTKGAHISKNSAAWKEKTSGWTKDYADAILPYGQTISPNSGAPICDTPEIVGWNAIAGMWGLIHKNQAKINKKIKTVLEGDPAGQANLMMMLERLMQAYPNAPAQK